MRHAKHTILAAAALAATITGAASEACGQVCCLLDPVVTHTNGVRLASSTPERSHNMYWQCDPLHMGYCGGRMHGPCRSDLRSTCSRPFARLPMPPGPAPGPVGVEGGHTIDGMEMATGERLGSFPLLEATILTPAVPGLPVR